MFVSFDKAFKPTENKNIIPDTILEYLNKQLSSTNLQYDSDENGHCVIISKNGEYKLSGFIFEVTPDIKNILGDNPSIEDIQEYYYNSQKKMPIKLFEDGYVYLNGEKIEIGKLDFDPFKEVQYVSGSIYVYPPKMNETIGLKMSGDTEEIFLKFERIPDDSLEYLVFKSEDDKPIRFLIKINRKNHKMTYTVSYDLKKVKNMKEILIVADIYNAFALGEGKMNDVSFTIDKDQKGEKAFTEEQIVFWKKMLLLEEKIGVNLKPFSKDVTNLDIYLGEVLYRTLTCKIPVRVRENIASVNGTGNIEKIKDEFGIQKPMAFYFEDYSTAVLFGTEIKLRSIKAIYNCIISELKEDNGHFKILLKNESDDKLKFTVAMYFLNDEELDEYKQTHNIMEEFKDAKDTVEYYNVN